MVTPLEGAGNRRLSATDPPCPTDLEALTLEVARAIVEPLRRLLEQLAPPADEWVSQAETPLTKRVHCALARRLSAEGHSGASIAGRRHLLTRAVISEHLRGLPAPKKAPTVSAAPSVVEELERELAVLRGGQ